MNYTQKTLGELLSSEDITIRRNAISILKVLQNCDHRFEHNDRRIAQCIYCGTLKPSGMR